MLHPRICSGVRNLLSSLLIMSSEKFVLASISASDLPNPSYIYMIRTEKIQLFYGKPHKTSTLGLVHILQPMISFGRSLDSCKVPYWHSSCLLETLEIGGSTLQLCAEGSMDRGSASMCCERAVVISCHTQHQKLLSVAKSKFTEEEPYLCCIDFESSMIVSHRVQNATTSDMRTLAAIRSHRVSEPPSR